MTLMRTVMLGAGQIQEVMMAFMHMRSLNLVSLLVLMALPQPLRLQAALLQWLYLDVAICHLDLQTTLCSTTHQIRLGQAKSSRSGRWQLHCSRLWLRRCASVHCCRRAMTL